MRNKVDNWTIGARNIKVFVWNIQTINLLQKNIRDIKINFILELINKQFPEIIYVIDAARTLKIGGNYTSYFDGRNLLFVRNDIDHKVLIGRNWFEIANLKLGLIYIIPNKYDKVEINKKLIEWEQRKWTYAGDFNLKSNKALNINWSGGETSLQTGVAGKAQSIRCYGSPSDHKLISFTIRREVKYNSILKVTRIKDEGKEYVDDLLEGKFDPDKIPLNKYQIENVRMIENEEELTIMKIINNYKRQKVTALYDKFGWMWRNNRKEPFLGTKVPQLVLDSFKKELGHKENKIKNKFNKEIKAIFSEADIVKWIKMDKMGNIKRIKIDLPQSKSKALTMEAIKLDEIGKAIRKKFEVWIFEGNKEKIINIQNQIIKAFNCLCDKGIFYANTFFLKKNNELKSYRDVRMITVVPVLLKVWETLIYYKVMDQVNRYMKNGEEYQMGAIQGSSTYYAMNALRAKVKRYDAIGIVSIDLIKGYEKVDHDILEAAINDTDIENNQRCCLLLWLQMVKNLDYLVNGKPVKASKGIPMGLSLSPLMFILYMDYGFKGLNKEFLLCFMDDINALILGQQGNDDFIKELFQRLDNVKMVVNEKKSKIFTYSEVISKQRRKEIFRNLPTSISMNYLGRELKWLQDGITGEFCDYVEEFNIPKVFPNWLTLAMRRLILIGGICAKHRYITYMWAFKRIEFKSKYLKEIFNFLKINFERLAYIQIILIYPNLIREFVDFSTWNNIGAEYSLAVSDILGNEDWKCQDIEVVKDRILSALEHKSEREKNSFVELETKLLNNLIEFLKTDMDQIDCKVGNRWNYFIIKSFLVLAAQYNGSWEQAKIGMKFAWEEYKNYKLQSWNMDRISEGRRLFIDLTDRSQFDYRYFVSYKYFGILLDMMFDKLKFDGDSDWDFWLFAMLEKIWSYLNNQSKYEDFFGELEYPKFKVLSVDRITSREKLVKNLVFAIANWEKIIYGAESFNRYMDPLSIQYKRWAQARKAVKRFRKLFFVLDSIYAKKDLKSKSYGEIVVAFQLKLYAGKVNNLEFEKIIIIQDYEELEENNYFLDEEFEEMGIED